MIFITTLLLKIIRLLLHISGRGRGTALPGLVGEKYFYKSLSKLPKHLNKIIVITGTNGKTTTSKIVRSILKQNKLKVLSNISGANLTRGILAALAFDTTFLGKLKSKIAIFEVEEASFEKVVKLLNPDIALITNLFRDQMDAYGELDHTREVIEKGLEYMKKDSVTLLNANDPKVTYMKKICNNTVQFYGIEDITIPTDLDNSVIDSTKSPDDRSDLIYEKIFFSHIGIYKSSNGKFKTPKLDYSVKNFTSIINTDKLNEISFDLHSTKVKQAISVKDFKLIGLYNVINCVAAFSVLENVKEIKESFVQDYSNISAAFGRGEKIYLKDSNAITLILVKNPTGFNSALSGINNITQKNIIFALNDNTADSKDVSWIWDCNFEALKNYKKVVVTGSRNADLALRCKYADIPYSLVDNYEDVIDEFILYKAEDGFIKSRKGVEIYALCSYTALLELRQFLSTISNIKTIEEEI